MSNEFLVLVLFFVLLPLIQQVLQSARRSRAAKQRSNQPGPQPLIVESQPAEHQPVRATRRNPRMPVAPGRELLDAAPEHAGARRTEPGSTARIPVAGLHSPGGLRATIVLMTILGPCRAIDPPGQP